MDEYKKEYNLWNKTEPYTVDEIKPLLSVRGVFNLKPKLYEVSNVNKNVYKIQINLTKKTTLVL